MAHDQCASFCENIPAYALGALDADEAAALEAHLQTCNSCRTELAAYRAVGYSLLMALPPQPPPAGLRRRLERQLPAKPEARRWWLVRFSGAQVALGVALVILIALNISSLLQIQALQREQAQIAHRVETDQAALAILAYPNIDSYPIWADEISGRLLVDKHHNVAALVLWYLPALPEDQTYQAWLIDSIGERTSLGVFRPEPGQELTTEVFFTQQDLSEFTGLGVTIEPAGGVPLPVGPRIIKVDFEEQK